MQKALLEVFCLLCLSYSAPSEFSLSADETAVIDVTEYFQSTAALSEVLHGSEQPRELFAAALDSDWHFGPSLSNLGHIYFCVLSSSAAGVWTVEGNALQQLWRSNLPYDKAVAVINSSFYGFMLWSKSSVMLVRASKYHFQSEEIKGIEFKDVLVLEVCKEGMKIVSIQWREKVYVYREYSLDRFHLIASLVSEVEFTPAAGEVLDAICDNHLFLIQEGNLVNFSLDRIDHIALPSILGRCVSLHHLSNGFSVLTAEGAAALIPSSITVFHGAKQVVQFDEQVVLLEGRSLVLRKKREEFVSGALQVVSLDCNESIELVWLRSGSSLIHPSLVGLRCGKTLSLLSLTFGYVYFFATSAPTPFTANLCAAEATCINLNIITAPESGIMLKDNNRLFLPAESTITEPLLLRDRMAIIPLILSDRLSGKNLNASLSFPEVPSRMTYFFAQYPGAETLTPQYTLATGNYQFGCSSQGESPWPIVMYEHRNALIFLNSTVSVRAQFEVLILQCAVDDLERLYILGSDNKGRNCLLVWHNAKTVEIHLSALEASNTLLSMRHTDSCLFLAFSTHIAVLCGDDWQRMHCLNGCLSLWAGDNMLLLLSQGAIGFYDQVGNTYAPRGEIKTQRNLQRAAYAADQLVAITEDNEVAVLHANASAQLTQRFSIPLDCSPNELTVVGEYIVYDCGDYYQSLSMKETKRSAKMKKIPRSRSSKIVSVKNNAICVLSVAGDNSLVTCHDISATIDFNIVFKFLDNFKFTRGVIIQGKLLVQSDEGSSLAATVNFELRNYCPVVEVAANNFPTVIEVPWEESASIDLSQHFSGEDIHLEGHSTNSSLNYTVVSAISPRNTLSITCRNEAIAICAPLSLIFSTDSINLIVSKYRCDSSRCDIVSRHIVPELSDSFSIIIEIELLLVIDSTAYLQVVKRTSSEFTENCVVSYDSESANLAVLVCSNDVHTVNMLQTTSGEIYVLLATSSLKLCTVRSEKATCDEVPGTVNVAAVGAQLQAGLWRVFVLTHQLLVYQLAGLLVLEETVALGQLDLASSRLLVSGNHLFVRKEFLISVYSLPELDFVSGYQIAYFGMKTRVKYSPDSPMLQSNAIGKGKFPKVGIFNMSAPEDSRLLAVLHAEVFIFTGPSTGAAYFNSTLTFMDISGGRLQFPKYENQTDVVEDEITVSATSELGTASLPALRVIRRPRQRRWWTWAVASVGVAVASSLFLRRKRAQAASEVEMHRLSQ